MEVTMRAKMVLGAIALVFSLAGCGLSLGGAPIQVVTGSGKVATDNRSVSNFNAVTLAGFGELTITQGDSEALTIEAEDNFLPYITTEVRNNTLTIGFQSGVTPRPTKPLRFDLKLKTLNAFSLSGAGNVQADALKGDQLALTLSGAGNLDFKNVQATGLTTTISGAGNANVAGQVTDQTVTLSGLGSYRAAELKSNTARVSVNGAGSATVWASESLNVSITGAGSVEYYGSPTLTKNITGVGTTKSLGNK